MKKIVEKNIYIILIILTIIFATLFTFSVRTESNDSLWNFSNTYKMYNGGTIYNDNNVIITPIFFEIGLIIFKLFGANVFIYGVYNVLIWTVLIFFVLKLFLTLEIKKNISCIMSILILLCSATLVAVGANYSVLALLFVIIRSIFSTKIQSKENQYYFTRNNVLFNIFHKAKYWCFLHYCNYL